MSLIEAVNERMHLRSFYTINCIGNMTIMSAKINFATDLQNLLKYALKDNIQFYQTSSAWRPCSLVAIFICLLS